MTNNNQLRKKVWDVFINSGHEKKLFSAQVAETPGTKVAQFSEFNEDHLAKAKAIWTEMFRIANGNAGNSSPDTDDATIRVEEAIDYLKQLNENPELKYYALKVFITHNERAKKVLHGTIPSILARSPFKVLPSVLNAEKYTATNMLRASKPLTGGHSDPEENKMNYLREDPLFNEHHEHWHVVYPNGGIPYTDANGNVTYKERQRHGEMFIYMHQQMLAHYDANRLAVGLPKVVPYDFSTKVEVGYDPGTFVQEFGDMHYSPRPKDWAIKSMPNYSVDQHLTFIRRMREVVKQGYITSNNKKIKLTADLLGMLIESLGGAVEEFGDVKSYYGNIHNLGHNLLSNAPGMPKALGVMCATATAIRDQVFFRWHRHVDDYSFTWQQTQHPNDFSDAPNVLVRNGFDYSPDIIICELSDIAKIGKETGLSSEQIGQQGFGNNNWNKDFTDAATKIFKDSTDTTGLSLKTHGTIDNYLAEGKIIVSDPANTGNQSAFPYEYLNHKQYGYFIRMQNLMPVMSKVTVRMFMVPKANAEDRRMWIELDKFTHVLQPNAKEVVFRRDLDSAIVRKPAITDPSAENLTYRPLSMTDMEGMFSAGIDGYLSALQALIVPGDPENGPSLVDYYNRFLTNPDHLEDSVNKAAFQSILNKYFNNITIGWEEIVKISNEGFKIASQPANKAFILAGHDQVAGDVVAFYNSFSTFIGAQATLLNEYKVSLVVELNNAMAKAFERVHEIAFCECGLPYNILYPRGTTDGLDYYIMVMLTDWNKDISSYENCCGSMSYCGTKTTYPDIREMGYPFNRPFSNGIMNALSTLDNVACRSVKIKLIKNA